MIIELCGKAVRLWKKVSGFFTISIMEEKAERVSVASCNLLIYNVLEEYEAKYKVIGMLPAVYSLV